MKVFLDTNVLVAAFATRGLCADVLRVVLGEHALRVTSVVLGETARALREKIRLPEARVHSIVALLSGFLVDESPEVELPEIVVRDPDDVAVVHSAIAAGADVLVTGDKDLLEAVLPLPVVSPRGFWELLHSRPAGNDEVHEPGPPTEG